MAGLSAALAKMFVNNEVRILLETRKLKAETGNADNGAVVKVFSRQWQMAVGSRPITNHQPLFTNVFLSASAPQRPFPQRLTATSRSQRS